MKGLSPNGSKGIKKWKSNLISLQLKATRRSQWTLAWYGDLVELNNCNELMFWTNMPSVKHSRNLT